jgi:hypothetical protein
MKLESFIKTKNEALEKSFNKKEDRFKELLENKKFIFYSNEIYGGIECKEGFIQKSKCRKRTQLDFINFEHKIKDKDLYELVVVNEGIKKELINTLKNETCFDIEENVEIETELFDCSTEQTKEIMNQIIVKSKMDFIVNNDTAFKIKLFKNGSKNNFDFITESMLKNNVLEMAVDLIILNKKGINKLILWLKDRNFLSEKFIEFTMDQDGRIKITDREDYFSKEHLVIQIDENKKLAEQIISKIEVEKDFGYIKKEEADKLKKCGVISNKAYNEIIYGGNKNVTRFECQVCPYREICLI